MNLREKQNYYVYPDSDYRYKQPPPLPRDVSEAMDREGLNDRYRFLWMGVAVIRKTELDPDPVIRGDKHACMLQPRDIKGTGDPKDIVLRLQPRKLYISARQIKDIVYENVDGHFCRVQRMDEVPRLHKGVPAVSFQYVDYGHLEWRIEQRITDKPLDLFPLFPGEDWMCIQTIKSADGLYQEPSVLHVQDLVKREYENRNAVIKEVVKADFDRKMAAQEAREKAEDGKQRRQIGEIVDEVFDWAERQPHSVQIGD